MTTQIDRAQVQDGGIFQCQVFVRDEVVPSSPIEVVSYYYIIYMHKTNINWMKLSTFSHFQVIIEARSGSTSAGTPSSRQTAHYYSCLMTILLFMTLQVIR